jgi:hypothetical protein
VENRAAERLSEVAKSQTGILNFFWGVMLWGGNGAARG